MSADDANGVTACDDCLRRTDLVAALAGRIDVAWRAADAPRRLLALPDSALLALDASGRVARRHRRFDAAAARRRVKEAGLSAVCRCAPGYPSALRELDDPPAVLHVAGDAHVLDVGPAAAIVGARRASTYGLEVAARLGRDLAAAGVTVVSGMALGVDSAAHAGALEAAGVTIAVLAGGADVPYPASKRRIHAGILRRGAVVSELPPGFTAHRWCFVARNRIIAALASVAVIVEATARSGSLITAGFAADLGRTVGAVPGQVTSRLAAGTNALLADGAPVVRDAADVLAHLDLPAPARGRGMPGATGVVEARHATPEEPELRHLLEAIEAGRGTVSELAVGGCDPRDVLRGLTALEIAGFVRREFGGRYVRAA